MSQSEIVKDFLIESCENLDRLDRDLVGLEKNPKDADAQKSTCALDRMDSSKDSSAELRRLVEQFKINAHASGRDLVGVKSARSMAAGL